MSPDDYTAWKAPEGSIHDGIWCASKTWSATCKLEAVAHKRAGGHLLPGRDGCDRSDGTDDPFDTIDTRGAQSAGATLCYMERIGVRELRQNASRYLDRVAAGETIEVTQRGELVARLVPPTVDPWAAMIAAGDVIPARLPHSTVLAEPPHDHAVDLSKVLADMRESER